ncbi:cytidylate kinase [Bordetella ansorpii]|uniref:Cytidylate kinase n=1 Tax=Bordetella ansorpii TaxID=288768 RepID=A0A157SCU7_9BORD|nr:(d)CMP kinase [Bordetella ansorpii]SAI68184.1 cytidylate kinase [Bordetella ansorpii]
MNQSPVAPSAGAVPVIAIDGPTASGKGTIAHRVADALGWTVLDSGALYRLTALVALNRGISPDDAPALAEAARTLDVRFEGESILLEGQEVTEVIRQEQVGNLASRIAAYPALREALLDRQRAFRQAPGLVADGRDMGTVVFPDAELKIFLVADVEARAQRRCKQLIDKGNPANIDDLLFKVLEDLRARDARDSQRAAAPLVAAADAQELDSSHLTIEQTVQAVLDHWHARAGQAER